MKRVCWGILRDEKNKVEIHRIVYEEDSDHGDKAGDVAWIIVWDDGGYSDPFSKLWIAKQILYDHLKGVDNRHGQ